MTSMDRAASADDRVGLLDKERIIAEPGFNRWLVPPAALAIHLSIGMAYGFSVFWLPLSAGASASTQPIAMPAEHQLRRAALLVTTTATGASSTRLDVHAVLRVLGVSAAILGGGWSGRARARRASSRRSAGAAVSCSRRVGVYLHQIWLLWLGSGVIGGFGLGLGYISPVSTLIKWFPTAAAWRPAWRSWASAAAP